MTHRIRMARKRLAIAIERHRAAGESFFAHTFPTTYNTTPAWNRWFRRSYEQTAIERRKDKTS